MKERTIISMRPFHYNAKIWGVEVRYRTLDGWEFTRTCYEVDELGAMAQLSKHFARLDARNEQRRRERSSKKSER